MYNECLALGIPEITFYGFTVDNTKRPGAQIEAFRNACVKAVAELEKRDADLLVVGNTQSALFPEELKRFTQRTRFGEGRIKVNFLVNYGWNWDLNHALKNGDQVNATTSRRYRVRRYLEDRSHRALGRRRRLSGFLPIQSVYADFYVVDELWPDFTLDQFHKALAWYQDQDVTLGG